MKSIIGILVLAVGAFQMISGGPIRSSGMVFYQPEYYNAHRAFVMQYASQPVKSYRRQGQASGVSAFASGKKISTGTFLRQETEDPHVAHSVAEAYPGGPPQHHSDEDNTEVSLDEDQSPENVIPPENIIPPEIAHDDPNDEILEAPVAVIPNKNKKTPPVANDEEVEDDEEEEEDKNVVKRTKNRTASGTTYFPVSFGSTNGGAIAIANSYSTGKGGTASSRATAYGSPAKSKSKRRNEQ